MKHSTIIVLALALVFTSQFAKADELVKFNLQTGYLKCQLLAGGTKCDDIAGDLKTTSMNLQGKSSNELSGTKVVELKVGQVLMRYMINISKNMNSGSLRYVIGVFANAYSSNNINSGGLIGYSIVSSLEELNTVVFLGDSIAIDANLTLKPSVKLSSSK
jgi:hypothetical protein